MEHRSRHRDLSIPCADLGVTKHYSPSDIILAADQSAKKVGFVLNGCVTTQAISTNGQIVWLDEFHAETFIGLAESFAPSSVPIEAIATEPTTIIWLKTKDVHALAQDDPEFMVALNRDFAERLNNRTMRLIEAVTLSAPGRVCAELARMASPLGTAGSSWVVRPNPIFVNVALRVSSTRETVSRTVTKMTQLGVLDRHVGAIIIPDMDRLHGYIR